MKSPENDGARHKQSWRRRNLRCALFDFFGVCPAVEGVCGGGVITASFRSPVEAPAPDSAVNHGRLMRLSHTHPVPTQTQTQGFPAARGRACWNSSPSLMCPLVSIDSSALICRFGTTLGVVMLPSLPSKHTYLILLSVL